jgi:Ca2+:H+ antiporter
VFQLKSHTSIYNEPSQKAVTNGSAKEAPPVSTTADKLVENKIEVSQLSVVGAIITLTISTVLIAFCSEFMVSSIDGITENGAIGKTFVGLILLPIVGNAAEHATAVSMAIKDRMDLSIGVAVGSSIQIALLVLPLIVILGWLTGHDCMTLYLGYFQIVVLFLSVSLVNYLIQDGKSRKCFRALVSNTILNQKQIGSKVYSSYVYISS